MDACPPASTSTEAGSDLRGAAGAGDHAVMAAWPAGFWRRALALLVDVAVWWLLLRVGDLPAALLRVRWELGARAFDYTVAIVVPAAYVTLFHGTGGQTLGKMLLGVRVVRAGGEPLGYPRALARYAAWWLSALPVLLGFVMAVLRRDRRALHDLIAGTRVVRVRRGARVDPAMMEAP